ncbi:hypothetical protein HDU82_000585 [Entophlyctis luteolus]|nr:hypothetical protein HDU82_000585 [Entophlyctis luteolus]
MTEADSKRAYGVAQIVLAALIETRVVFAVDWRRLADAVAGVGAWQPSRLESAKRARHSGCIRSAALARRAFEASGASDPPGRIQVPLVLAALSDLFHRHEYNGLGLYARCAVHSNPPPAVRPIPAPPLHLFILTGPHGHGKSAIAGRLVRALANPRKYQLRSLDAAVRAYFAGARVAESEISLKQLVWTSDQHISERASKYTQSCKCKVLFQDRQRPSLILADCPSRKGKSKGRLELLLANAPAAVVGVVVSAWRADWERTGGLQAVTDSIFEAVSAGCTKFMVIISKADNLTTSAEMQFAVDMVAKTVCSVFAKLVISKYHVSFAAVSALDNSCLISRAHHFEYENPIEPLEIGLVDNLLSSYVVGPHKWPLSSSPLIIRLLTARIDKNSVVLTGRILSGNLTKEGLRLHCPDQRNDFKFSPDSFECWQSPVSGAGAHLEVGIRSSIFETQGNWRRYINRISNGKIKAGGHIITCADARVCRYRSLYAYARFSSDREIRLLREVYVAAFGTQVKAEILFTAEDQAGVTSSTGTVMKIQLHMPKWPMLELDISNLATHLRRIVLRSVNANEFKQPLVYGVGFLVDHATSKLENSLLSELVKFPFHILERKKKIMEGLFPSMDENREEAANAPTLLDLAKSLSSMQINLKSWTPENALLEADKALKILKQVERKIAQVASSAREAKSGSTVVEEAAETEAKAPCYICSAKCASDSSGKVPLCPSCEDFNNEKLAYMPSLSTLPGAVVVTGARIKIGYAVALRLIDSHAPLVVLTTRFPFTLAEALLRDRPQILGADGATQVHIYGADFRSPNVVGLLTNHWRHWYPSVSAIINNAAQTIRRPAAFYQPIVETEQQIIGRADARVMRLVKQPPDNPFDDAEPRSSGGGGLLSSSLSPPPFDALLQVASATESSLFTQLKVLPHDFEQFDAALYPPAESSLSSSSSSSSSSAAQDPVTGEVVQDGRAHNTWTQAFTQTHPLEALETLVVNAWAPFAIVQALAGRLAARAVVVGVTSRKEGAAERQARDGGLHAHSNMAKAALEAMTRSVAAEVSGRRDRSPVPRDVLVCAVDPGWVSTFAIPRTASADAGHTRKSLPPLTYEDAAARILDPVVRKMGGEDIPNGVLFRNYKIVD